MFNPFNTLVSLYLAVYIITILPSLIISNYATYISNNTVIIHLNDILIENYAYFWFTLIYLCFLLMYCNNNWKISSGQLRRFALTYIINTIFYIGVVKWCFGPSVFLRINVASGGICENNPLLSAHQCITNNEIWVNGFDISGHFYVIVNCSLLIWRECLNLISYHGAISDIPHEFDLSSYINLQNYNVTFKSVLLSMALCLLLAWLIMFVITCLFFHTPLEKLAGLLFGYAIPLISEAF